MVLGIGMERSRSMDRLRLGFGWVLRRMRIGSDEFDRTRRWVRMRWFGWWMGWRWTGGRWIIIIILNRESMRFEDQFTIHLLDLIQESVWMGDEVESILEMKIDWLWTQTQSLTFNQLLNPEINSDIFQKQPNWSDFFLRETMSLVSSDWGCLRRDSSTHQWPKLWFEIIQEKITNQSLVVNQKWLLIWTEKVIKLNFNSILQIN